MKISFHKTETNHYPETVLSENVYMTWHISILNGTSEKFSFKTFLFSGSLRTEDNFSILVTICVFRYSLMLLFMISSYNLFENSIKELTLLTANQINIQT